ncbi:MAG: archease [Candidatus Nanoarchaeia archaeon]
MEKYRFLKDLTSDVMFEAYGDDLAEVFENSARALFEIICQREKISKEKTVKITTQGDDEQDLLFNWLQALIASVDIDEMFYNDFKVKEITKNYVTCECFGEDITPEKGETVVKAVTYYNFSLEKTENSYKSKVTVDI